MTEIIKIESNLPSTQDNTKVAADLIESFLAELSVKEKSKKSYREWIKYYLKWAEKNNILIGQATRADLIKYKLFLDESKMSKSSVGSLLVIVRKLYAWFHANGYYPMNIGIGISSPKVSKDFKKRGLTQEEVGKLLDWSQTNQSKRDYAIICLFSFTGLREMSVVAANIEDIQEVSGNRLLYYLSKGRDEKDKHVVLVDEAWLPIQNYLQGRGAYKNTDPLFVSESRVNIGKRLTTKTLINVAREALDAIGLYSEDKYHPHSLRHSCGQNLLRAGATLEQVQWILGHESIETTMGYVRYIENERRAANAPERLLSGFFKRNK